MACSISLHTNQIQHERIILNSVRLTRAYARVTLSRFLYTMDNRMRKL